MNGAFIGIPVFMGRQTLALWIGYSVRYIGKRETVNTSASKLEGLYADHHFLVKSLSLEGHEGGLG